MRCEYQTDFDRTTIRCNNKATHYVTTKHHNEWEGRICTEHIKLFEESNIRHPRWLPYTINEIV